MLILSNLIMPTNPQKESSPLFKIDHDFFRGLSNESSPNYKPTHNLTSTGRNGYFGNWYYTSVSGGVGNIGSIPSRTITGSNGGGVSTGTVIFGS